mmetsp:Transcript_71979/g.187256  ORF Transcript_71979/g.187256 Transcript_71979/m.187256 type:complete len:544 (-) Transcript_71979:159-1790(-)
MYAPPFDVSEVDVVIADDEEICLAAGGSALRRFGFVHVHEAETGQDAMAKVAELQQRGGLVSFAGRHDRSLPIIVVLDMKMPDAVGCAKQLCELYRQRGLRREPFLVRASSSLKPDQKSLFHCAVPKTFATYALQCCFENCQHWWIQGGGQPGKVQLNVSVYAAPSLDALPIMSEKLGRLVSAPASSHAVAKTQIAPMPRRISEPTSPTHVQAQAARPQMSPMPRMVSEPSSSPHVTPSNFNRTTAGNSIESLDNLAPPPTPFEDVQMVCLVGRGSFGRVYRARWDISTVALKVVEEFDQAKPSIMAFEGKLSSSLAHPNLVQTFKYAVRDILSPAGATNSLRGFELWIVQEWCSLGTLSLKISSREIMENGGFDEVVEVSAEVSSAAHYLHCRGIIHGDLTASNILLVERRCNKGYTCKISDFGLARILDNGASGINTATMGTVAYMPPELFQLEGCALTKKVDVYAFGVIMWQLCTSSTPFEGLQPTQVVVMVAQGASIDLPPGVPDAIVRLFKACVARKPNDRPFFAQIVQDLLKLAILS